LEKLRFDLITDLRDVSPEDFGRPEPFVISSVSADRLEDPLITRKVIDLRSAKKPVPSWLSGTPTSFAHRFSSAMMWIATTTQEGFASLGDVEQKTGQGSPTH
jgi:hypothetical protein